MSSQVTLAGRANGFALPSFTWTLNGTALIGSNTWRRTTVSMVATDTLPGIGEPAVVVDLPVQYQINSVASTSTLLIRNLAFPGNGKLEITLSAVESLVAGDAPTTFSDTTTLLTRGYKILWPWAGDVAACNPKEVETISNALRSLAHRLVEDENRPNPNPASVRALANVARQYVEAMDVVTGGNRDLDLAVLSLAMELDPSPVSLGALTYNQIATGTRILSPLAECWRHDLLTMVWQHWVTMIWQANDSGALRLGC